MPRCAAPAGPLPCATRPDSSDSLVGLRVLDLAAVLAAPVAATLLGEFGADVIKVEDPGRGDFPRRHAADVGGRTPQWLQEGRNKHSVTIDLRKRAGQDLARRLAGKSDVAVVNFRPQTAARWGLAPDDLLGLNDQLIVLCVTGYGLTGPYAERGAFDRIASAFSGHTEVSGYPDRPPVRGGFATIDFLSAYLGAFAVLAALRARDNGEGGQVIDLALYEAAFRANEAALAEFAASGRPRVRVGNRHPTIVPATECTAADGRRISYHAGTDPLLQRLAEVIEHPDLLSDPRFATYEARVGNQDELYRIVEVWVRARPASEVVRQFSDAGIPASSVNTLADLLENEHFRARGTFEMIVDEELGTLPIATPVPRLSKTPGRTRHLGLALGACNDEILGGLLGVGPSEQRRLRHEGVI
jgi:crotonobetainyl-CoA:carnitine CoA-transferase CaiB-like acyl-CoA transferase